MEPEAVETGLASPARRRVYALIEQSPGLSVSDIAQRLNLFWTSAALHIEHLTSAGLVRSVKAGRRRVLIPVSLLEDVSAAHRGLLAEPACRRVAAAVVAHPDERVYEICERLDMSDRAVYHHLKRLVDAGLVRSPAGRGYRGMTATPELVAILIANNASRRDDSHESTP